MKKLIFGLIAMACISNNLIAQYKNFDKNEMSSLDMSYVNTNQENIVYNDVDVQIKCKKINVGINIFIAWASTDFYIACGFPMNLANTTGCYPVSEAACNSFNSNRSESAPSSSTLNIKSYFKDIDIAKVDIIEITESSTWKDEIDGSETTIKLGKYPVDKDGNFEVEILVTN